jgi:hypothetical protein
MNLMDKGTYVTAWVYLVLILWGIYLRVYLVGIMATVPFKQRPKWLHHSSYLLARYEVCAHLPHSCDFLSLLLQLSPS